MAGAFAVWAPAGTAATTNKALTAIAAAKPEALSRCTGEFLDTGDCVAWRPRRLVKGNKMTMVNKALTRRAAAANGGSSQLSRAEA